MKFITLTVITFSFIGPAKFDIKGIRNLEELKKINTQYTGNKYCIVHTNRRPYMVKESCLEVEKKIENLL